KGGNFPLPPSGRDVPDDPHCIQSRAANFLLEGLPYAHFLLDRCGLSVGGGLRDRLGASPHRHLVDGGTVAAATCRAYGDCTRRQDLRDRWWDSASRRHGDAE